ncbi:MAG: hypothetical protein BGO07_00800 [Alphaproteobacteria bacterium 40-19]|nr:MAG: hypothetical protein BGO07_00800 [Alphaproteobacteria bacterium 40-19]
MKKLFGFLIPSFLWAGPNGAIQVRISKKDPHLYLVSELYSGEDEDTCFTEGFISCRYDHLSSGAEKKSVTRQYEDGTKFEVYTLYNVQN